MKHVGYVWFDDVKHGAQHQQGWWVITDCDYSVIAECPDDDPRTLVGHTFIHNPGYNAKTAALAAARTVFPAAVVALGDEDEGGWRIESPDA